MSSRELHNTVIFVFNKNLVFVALFKKGTYRISLLFEAFSRIHKEHMKGELLLYIVHISGSMVIDTIIYFRSIRNNQVGIMK